jgi:hypothetical protein
LKALYIECPQQGSRNTTPHIKRMGSFWDLEDTIEFADCPSCEFCTLVMLKRDESIQKKYLKTQHSNE